jgi:hypothetical protein
LASCLVIISLFVVLLTYMGAMSKSYLMLVIVDSIYLLALWGYMLLFTGKNRSETLKHAMMLFSIVGAAASIYLMWAYFTFTI